MATLTSGQLYSLARNAGLSPPAAATAAAVAEAESGGVTDAQGDVGLEDNQWGPSVGLWQIRSLKAQYGTGQPRDASRLTDPSFNAASMASISGTGSNFKPWTTYTSGAYKKHLVDVQTSAAAGGLPSWLVSLGTGGLVPAAAAGGDAAQSAVSSLTSSWGKDAMTIGIKVVAAAAAAGLVVAGAMHSVSKG